MKAKGEMAKRILFGLPAALIPFLVVACSTAPVVRSKPRIATAPIPAAAYSPPKKEPSKNGIKELKELPLFQIEEEKTIEPKYTFTLRDADIKEVLLAISQRTKLNITMDQDVEGKVTIDLKQVTLTQSLRALLTPLGLEFESYNGFIRVSKPKIETRLFFLNYVSTVRSGSRTTSTSTSMSGGMGGGGGGGTGSIGGGGGGVIGGSTSTVTGTDNADIFTDIEKGIKTLLSEKGKMVINKQASSIVATDFPANLNKIGEFLEAVEGSVQRQVLIQTNIIEVILSDDYQFGIDWSIIPGPGLGIKGTLTGGAAWAQALGSGATAFRIGESVRLGHFIESVSVLADALSHQGQVNVLSTPRISTLNNQKAVIRVGTNEVFFQETLTLPTATAPPIRTFSPQSVTVGIVLDVTPQIGSDGTIIMNIHPSISEKTGQATAPDGTTTPIIAVRETDTVVKVREGETIVIGGLISERKTKDQTSIPLLGSIPVMGALFRKVSDEVRKSELVITLTPFVHAGKAVGELSQAERNKLFGTNLSPKTKSR